MEAQIRLKGQDLLNFIASQAGRPEADVAMAAGYVRRYKRKDDSGEVKEHESPQIVDFYRAQGAAQGVKFALPVSSARLQKPLKKRALHVQASGKLILSPCYLLKIGMERGDQVIVEEADGKLVISKHQVVEEELPFQEDNPISDELQFYNHGSLGSEPPHRTPRLQTVA